jgi:RNA polymerase sigma-70 factor (ECF subfamily)
MAVPVPDSPEMSSAPAGPRPLLDGRSTTDLLELLRNGDATAVDALFRRVLPPLRRWARGRLPRGVRDLLDTEDLVQDTAMKILPRLSGFESRGGGSLLAYMREAVLNRIRDEADRRRPLSTGIDDHQLAGGPTPLDEAIGQELAGAYERALQKLTALQREAVIARIELNQSYEEIALALDRPSANAARSLIVRALYRLHKELARGRR